MTRKKTKEFEIEAILFGYNQQDLEIDILDFGPMLDVDAELMRTLEAGEDIYSSYVIAKVVKVANSRTDIREFADNLPEGKDSGTADDQNRGPAANNGGCFEEGPDCSGWC